MQVTNAHPQRLWLRVPFAENTTTAPASIAATAKMV